MKKTQTATRARTVTILATIAATSLFGTSASGRENPLSIITDHASRAELMIVLDTSGSMTWDPATGAKSGVDCGGGCTGTPNASLTAIDSYASVDALDSASNDPDAAHDIQRVTFYMTHTEMERAGAWDAAALRPKEQFKWHGTSYVLLSGAGLPVTADSLYAQVDDISEETRFPFDTAGVKYSDGTQTWKFKGAYYT